MKAIVRRPTRLVVDEVPDPVPVPGTVLVRALACGIRGSDLHAVVAAALTPDDVPLVIGYGPIGLSVIAALKPSGASPIVAP